MYTLSQKLENIRNIYIDINNFIIVDKNETYYLNGKTSSGYKSLFFVLEGHILKRKSENVSFLYNGETLVKELHHSYIFKTYSEEGCFYYENQHYDKIDNKIKKDIYYHNFKNDTTKLFAKEFSENFQLVIDNCAITYQPKTTLKSLSLLTGEYEWETDLSQYGKIRNILGVVGDELYVWLGHTTLVAVNIHDGSVQWHINTYETYQVGFDYGVHLLAEERKVVLFQTVQYVEIDLQSRKSELLYKTEFNESWEFSANTVVGNYIYFVGRNYATDELSVGAFSRTSLQVEWYYAAPEWQGTVPDDYEGEAVVLGNAPQVTEDKLYVLENGTGTLYIFEKEEA